MSEPSSAPLQECGQALLPLTSAWHPAPAMCENRGQKSAHGRQGFKRMNFLESSRKLKEGRARSCLPSYRCTFLVSSGVQARSAVYISPTLIHLAI
eukprot:1159776-Pelagomonas_calceolata.AAC.10